MRSENLLKISSALDINADYLLIGEINDAIIDEVLITGTANIVSG
jgi:hypothetical protein